MNERSALNTQNGLSGRLRRNVGCPLLAIYVRLLRTSETGCPHMPDLGTYKGRGLHWHNLPRVRGMSCCVVCCLTVAPIIVCPSKRLDQWDVLQKL